MYYLAICDCALGLFAEFPGYEADPCEVCDGKVRLIEYQYGQLPVGLLPMLWGKKDRTDEDGQQEN